MRIWAASIQLQTIGTQQTTKFLTSWKICAQSMHTSQIIFKLKALPYLCAVVSKLTGALVHSSKPFHSIQVKFKPPFLFLQHCRVASALWLYCTTQKTIAIMAHCNGLTQPLSIFCSNLCRGCQEWSSKFVGEALPQGLYHKSNRWEDAQWSSSAFPWSTVDSEDTVWLSSVITVA